MLLTHRVGYYLTHCKKTYRKSIIRILPIVKSLESSHRRNSSAFTQSPKMLPADQQSEAKRESSNGSSGTSSVKTGKNQDSKRNKGRHRQKTKQKQEEKPKSTECKVVGSRGQLQSHGPGFIYANKMQSSSTPVYGEALGTTKNADIKRQKQSGPSNVTDFAPESPDKGVTPKEKLQKDVTPPRSAQKSAKNSSHRRRYHSEGTPNKGGLPKMNCSEYWNLGRVEEGIKEGTVVTGSFRINPRNYTTGYITALDGQKDIVIEGIDRRNRAMHGDLVAVELVSDDEAVTKEVADISRKLAIEFGTMQLTEEKLQKVIDHQRGRVVHIMEKRHCRKAAGVLKPYQHNAYGFAQFSPQDSRVPRIMISLSECPEEFVARPQDFQNVLFIASISNWKATCAMASGKLVKQLGDMGEIEPETEGFLAAYNIDDGPFPEEALACLPTDTPWTIPADEYAKRKDLREHCIFTIDPATARDLDDALSVKLKEDGNFEVGVHIADVSYFIDEGSALDNVASRRATSVYLVQKVVPMLPRLLCEQLCSLNPGNDKLTYSVMWTITSDGKIQDEWFGRTIIRSCTKLAYEHAQQMITTDIDDLDWSQFPTINGPHEVTHVHECVRHLYDLSLLLRQKRFESGALSLNQPKLSFTLDKETGLPNGFGSYVATDSNRLVEEFMLLANMAVAHRLFQSLPEHAILRRHPSPHPKMIEDLLTLCKRCGVAIDATTSLSLHKSLQSLKDFDSSEKAALYFAVISLCSKPMQLAKYFCAGALENTKLYHHYALNVPLYTHFTSPIRRYPDIMVHRMLTVALRDDVQVMKSVEQLQQLAEGCNDKKASAKKVQELSSELFFTSYVRQLGELREQAVIIGMLDSSLDVLLLHSGLVKRIYCNALPLLKWKADKEQKDSMTLYWKTEEEISLHGNEALNRKEVFDQNEALGGKEALNGDDALNRNEVLDSNEVGKDTDGTTPTVGNALESGGSVAKSSNVQSDKNGDGDGDGHVGLMQVLHVFDRTDVILKAEEDKGICKIKVYLPKPE